MININNNNNYLSFENLPNDILFLTLSFLPAETLGKIAKVSKKIKLISEEPMLWNALAKQYKVSILPGQNPKTIVVGKIKKDIEEKKSLADSNSMRH